MGPHQIKGKCAINDFNFSKKTFRCNTIEESLRFSRLLTINSRDSAFSESADVLKKRTKRVNSFISNILSCDKKVLSLSCFVINDVLIDNINQTNNLNFLMWKNYYLTNNAILNSKYQITDKKVINGNTYLNSCLELEEKKGGGKLYKESTYSFTDDLPISLNGMFAELEKQVEDVNETNNHSLSYTKKDMQGMKVVRIGKKEPISTDHSTPGKNEVNKNNLKGKSEKSQVKSEINIANNSKYFKQQSKSPPSKPISTVTNIKHKEKSHQHHQDPILTIDIKRRVANTKNISEGQVPESNLHLNDPFVQIRSPKDISSFKKKVNSSVTPKVTLAINSKNPSLSVASSRGSSRNTIKSTPDSLASFEYNQYGTANASASHTPYNQISYAAIMRQKKELLEKNIPFRSYLQFKKQPPGDENLTLNKSSDNILYIKTVPQKPEKYGTEKGLKLNLSSDDLSISDNHPKLVSKHKKDDIIFKLDISGDNNDTATRSKDKLPRNELHAKNISKLNKLKMLKQNIESKKRELPFEPDNKHCPEKLDIIRESLITENEPEGGSRSNSTNNKETEEFSIIKRQTPNFSNVLSRKAQKTTVSKEEENENCQRFSFNQFTVENEKKDHHAHGSIEKPMIANDEYTEEVYIENYGEEDN